MGEEHHHGERDRLVYSSTPVAVPIAATAQKVAAVDNPRTWAPSWTMTPAPRKPIPVAMAPKPAPGLVPPYVTAIRAKRQAAAATRAEDRSPPGWRRHSRSAPMAPPSRAAMRMAEAAFKGDGRSILSG